MKLTTVLIGLNDKDTKKQEIATDIAKSIVACAFASACDGATVSDAIGIYTHNDGKQVQEKSIRVEIFNGDDVKIIEAIHEIKRSLNQESIIKSDVETNTQFI